MRKPNRRDWLSPVLDRWISGVVPSNQLKFQRSTLSIVPATPVEILTGPGSKAVGRGGKRIILAVKNVDNGTFYTSEDVQVSERRVLSKIAPLLVQAGMYPTGVLVRFNPPDGLEQTIMRVWDRAE
jgi:hypothetical protein